MKIAIASGKGGTGKTTVAISFALSVDEPIRFLDCDVEEPNAALFLELESIQEREVTVPVPVINEDLCTGCGECARFCEFNAIVHVGTTVMVFPDLCHSCGGCTLVCPEKAITEVPERIGLLKEARVKGRDIQFAQGLLDIGKAMSPPVIREVKATITGKELTIIDAPPGTSCPMTTTVSDTDFIVLVTEPTHFGYHDLILAVKTIKQMNIPFGVIINRSNAATPNLLKKFEKKNIPVLMEIQEDRNIAEAYSQGMPLIEAAPEYKKAFASLPQKIKTLLEASNT